ncbi:acyltransferase [Sphingobium algorifonticola]|uniref:Acyltransferase n=1 Tax=Sphingobium algorifonticola TaxID=2008318 RepID=A0A437JDK0_9SPHN|nr:acyltransferase [Sphingobium algorifonticola]
MHAWTGRTGEELAHMAGSGQELLRWTVMEGLGKSAVPLLGMISGYLLAGSRRALHWRSHVSAKARTILLPMLLWNAIAIGCVSGAAMAGLIQAPVPHSARWMIEEMLALTRAPDINVQMPFLRDLFVCMLIAPWLVRWRPPALALLAAAIAGVAVIGLPQPLLLRPIILLFFVTGMIAGKTVLAERAAALPLIVALLPFLLLMPVKVALSLPPAPFSVSHPHAMALLDLAMRIAAALAFWRMAHGIAQTRLRIPLLRIEPYAFFLFCAHLVLIWLGGPAIGQWTGPLGTPLYPTFLLMQPLLALAASILLAKAISHISPRAARILSGGRLARSDDGLAPARKMPSAKRQVRPTPAAA